MLEGVIKSNADHLERRGTHETQRLRSGGGGRKWNTSSSGKDREAGKLSVSVGALPKSLDFLSTATYM